MTQITFEQALATVRQLPPRERARLVAVVVEELAMPPVADHVQDARQFTLPAITGGAWSDEISASRADLYDDAWAQWDALREELRAAGPVSPTAGDQLDWDRQARDAVLMGLEGASDVHS